MKNGILKKIIAIMLINTLLLCTPLMIANATSIEPRYNNVTVVSTTASISSSGIITIDNMYNGKSNVTTGATITTYIEKKVLGLFWSRVEIGQTNDEWVDSVSGYNYEGTHYAQLTSSGKYRVTAEYVIYGNNGSPDTVTKEVEKNY